MLSEDHLGSVRRVVRLSDGVVVRSVDYDAFGKVTGESGTFEVPFGFAGGLEDRETGLVRFGARDYDPRVGRWTSKDESGFGGGLNFYAYADGDPVNLIDTTGMKPEEPIPDAWWMPPGVRMFGAGVRMRADGIAMMSNDATFRQGQRKAACGGIILAAGATVVGVEAEILVGAAHAAPKIVSAAGAIREAVDGFGSNTVGAAQRVWTRSARMNAAQLPHRGGKVRALRHV